MKFTDGFWLTRPGVTAQYALEAYDIDVESASPGVDGDRIVVTAPTRVIERRGDVLNRTALTVTLSSPLEGVIRVRIDHFQGARRSRGFELVGAETGLGDIVVDARGGTITSGSISARVSQGAPWNLEFSSGGRVLTSSGHKSVGFMELGADAAVSAEPAGVAGVTLNGRAHASSYIHEQLDITVGETIYGLGERFGPLVKNGQTVDIWNADGGTASEQSYKSVPFYLSSRGYGVFVNQPEHVSFEVGSETVERVQFSTSGESLEYFVIDGPTPKDVLERYTTLTGKPARVPDWSYGLWLSTSFTTDYDEETVGQFIDGMRERDIPLSVFHFDCFWMREFHWTDFEWDARVFPDPEGMLERLHGKDLRLSAWINPYIAQRSSLFAEAASQGFLVRRANGDIWQWDQWVAGMALVDFTNPGAVEWFQGKVRGLVRQGIDAIKTDFGERIPTDVVWFDGTAPETMHNLYAQLYNQAVFAALESERGAGEAVLFARSATAGGQRMPIHWGGDNTSSFVSMAETLRGGLSLAMSGFGYWSHDIGGFEGRPDPEVFKRWVAFGLLSSHSRLHGSSSYRVPWMFDDEAVEVTRRFAQLKFELMPYLSRVGVEAHERGLPFMRPMQLEFADDPAVRYLDRQYMLGSDLLVAPVFTESGEVEYYLPAGRWTNYLTGEQADGGVWRSEVHDVFSVPLWVREGAVLPIGGRTDRPDYDYTEGLTLRMFAGDVDREVTVVAPGHPSVVFRVRGDVDGLDVRSEPAVVFSVATPGSAPRMSVNGAVRVDP
ncbi:alpha-xylosidase [Marisediminicola sp. LYQ85]|uniref:alpha-xylosidase n=1 Tax=Marisediminicola sp. LYQ85 TaxID=3391062 RepID=UPI003983927B